MHVWRQRNGANGLLKIFDERKIYSRIGTTKIGGRAEHWSLVLSFVKRGSVGVNHELKGGRCVLRCPLFPLHAAAPSSAL